MSIWNIVENVVRSITGGRSKYSKDVEQLTEFIKDRKLSPWTDAEIDLIARRTDKKKGRGRNRGVHHGVYYSIYHEAMLSYAVKQYARKENRLIVARMNGHNYAYVIDGHSVNFDSDHVIKGIMDLSHGVRGRTARRQFSVESKGKDDMQSIRIDGQTVLFLAGDQGLDDGQTRVVRRFREFGAEEGELLRSVIAFALIEGHI